MQLEVLACRIPPMQSPDVPADAYHDDSTDDDDECPLTGIILKLLIYIFLSFTKL